MLQDVFRRNDIPPRVRFYLALLDDWHALSEEGTPTAKDYQDYDFLLTHARRGMPREEKYQADGLIEAGAIE